MDPPSSTPVRVGASSRAGAPSGSSAFRGLSGQSNSSSAAVPALGAIQHSPQPSPPLRPMTRDPLRIGVQTSPDGNGVVVPAAAASSSAFSSSAGQSTAVQSAKERSERTRLLDDEFRLRSRSDDELSDDADTEAARLAAGPFIQHSYQAGGGGTADSSGYSSSAVSPIPGGLGESAVVSETTLGRWLQVLLLPMAIVLSVCNSITWKRMLNRYASIDGSHRNLEFFVNQWTLLLYTIVCGAVFAYRWYCTDLITSVGQHCTARPPVGRSFDQTRSLAPWCALILVDNTTTAAATTPSNAFISPDVSFSRVTLVFKACKIPIVFSFFFSSPIALPLLLLLCALISRC